MKHTILSITNRINLLENRTQKENSRIVNKLRRELKRLSVKEANE